jgi:hypothetical protein
MEKPILFNTEMVKAILKGRKTTTRRIIKRTSSNDEPCGYGFWKEYNEDNKRWYIKDYTHACVWWTLEEYIRKFSKYQIGDILYVRETWLAHSRGLNTIAIKYKADDAINECVSFTKERFNKFYKFADQEKWQPSLFMPKEAARIFLKVTDVRVERLQDIDYDNLISEGTEIPRFATEEALKVNFKNLWNGTLKKDLVKVYSWDTNPYVWVIQFEVIER